MSKLKEIRRKISVWWWRMKPCPCTIKEGGFEKLVEWCAKGEQNRVIYQSEEWHDE